MRALSSRAQASQSVRSLARYDQATRSADEIAAEADMPASMDARMSWLSSGSSQKGATGPRAGIPRPSDAVSGLGWRACRFAG
jgi:hypothetical protein